MVESERNVVIIVRSVHIDRIDNLYFINIPT